MSGADMTRRLTAISIVVAQRAPAVLAATTALLEAMLVATDSDIVTERTPTAPIALTAEQVLEAARARGVPTFSEAVGQRRILLASLGIDLTDPRIRAALVEMHQRRELRLARIADIGAARADLTARGLRVDLVDESAISDGDTTFHEVIVS